MERPPVAAQEFSLLMDDGHSFAEQDASAGTEEGSQELGEQVPTDAPIVKLVSQLITQAVTDRVSDIYIEPTERDVRIRHRIEGVLHEAVNLPKNIQGGLISRVKVMADINIAERRLPQVGRLMLNVAGKQVDLTIATLPTVYGEALAIRILDRSSALYRLDELGFLDVPYQRYERSFRKPQGAILVTGPTGSGKSTTLYATLDMINGPDRVIFTIEDPVEYRLAGVNQLQVNGKAGLTFAAALRSILRVGPDVVMIGEVGDPETALIGIQGALTGHLVLSTLYTNDAPSAITRLIEMGIEPHLVASAMECVVAQRLARRLCEGCKEPDDPSEAELAAAGMSESPGRLFRPVGCSQCGKTGYRGRLGLFEVMPVTEEIERLAMEQRSPEEIRRMAEEQGLISMRGDGVDKVRKGLTSLEEILRVTT